MRVTAFRENKTTNKTVRSRLSIEPQKGNKRRFQAFYDEYSRENQAK